MENPVESIRDHTRYNTYRQRQDNREYFWGRNRIISDAVPQEILSTEQVKIVSEKLKYKSKVKREDLSALKQALFHNVDNTAVFFSVDGALQSIIRELSGHDAMRQLEAACCCCNLALGDPRYGPRLTKAAAPYLVAHLDGLSTVIVDVCVWTIGNLASNGGACWQTLHSQGVLGKLLRLLHAGDDKLTPTIIYTLTHYVKAGLDSLRPEELVETAIQTHHLLESQPTSYWLIFLLSFPPPSTDVLAGFHTVSRCCALMLGLVGDAGQQVSRLTALLRTVGNLVAREDGAAAVELLSSQALGILKLLLLPPSSRPAHLRKECLWLLSNVWAHPDPTVQSACAAHPDVEQELLNSSKNIEEFS